MDTPLLAFQLYPFAPHNKDMKPIPYTAEDLSDLKKVEELFDLAQILEAYITYDGWQFLIKKYGWEKLYESNNRSGWIDADDLEDYQEWVKYEMEITPWKNE